MAANLQMLKRRIKTAQNIAQVSRAMEMIAASKIKKAQALLLNNKPYALKIAHTTQKLMHGNNVAKTTLPYITHGNSPKKLLIALSPDRGLCGSLVTSLSKRFLDMDSKNLTVVTIGKKIEHLALKFGYSLLATFPMGSILPKYSVVYPLIKIIDDAYLTGEVSQVEILYPSFQSIFAQPPVFETLLPIQPLVENSEEPQGKPTLEENYIFEPEVSSLLSSLLRTFLETRLYHTIASAYTSEQAARMLAMQNAKNNALDIGDYLTRDYNKSRQERITSDILDLANGQRMENTLYG